MERISKILIGSIREANTHLVSMPNGSVRLSRSTIISIGRIEPKKSVMRTLFGSRWNRSFLTPTVDMHTRFGQTFSYGINENVEFVNEKKNRNEKNLTYKFTNGSLTLCINIFEELQCIVSVTIDDIHTDSRIDVML